MSADKLASFRVDSQLWEQFQGYAKSQNSTATALLISYIKSVVNTGNVITSNPVVNTSSEANNSTLSIQDIDNRIDDKIKLSIQGIDTLSIQDIDNRIDDSLTDGKIGDAIATSYEATMGQFNGLLEELQALQKQIQELQSIPPAPVPSPQIEQESVTENEPLPILDAIASVENNEHEPINNNDQIKIEELKLPVYVHNALKRQQVNTVGELLKYSEADFLSIKGMGIKALSDLKDACQRQLGIKFPAP